ncbi:MAG TPA: Hsp20/alpha crystallin family protein [bacterium]|nr:Hsp20/alpha crystallin family protein [bacterium]
MALIRWTPIRGVMSFRDEMDRLLDEFYGRMSPSQSQESFEGDWCPVLDIAENENDVTAAIELPGLEKDDIKVSIEDDVLTVTGEKKQESTENTKDYRKVERSYGYFKRSVKLPSSVEPGKVKAAYKDGVLRVTMPKLASKKPKEIAIQVS